MGGFVSEDVTSSASSDCEIKVQLTHFRSQGFVHFENLGAVEGLRILQRRFRAVRNVSGRVSGANIPNVKFILQCHLHLEACKGHRAECSLFRVDASDTGN